MSCNSQYLRQHLARMNLDAVIPRNTFAPYRARLIPPTAASSNVHSVKKSVAQARGEMNKSGEKIGPKPKEYKKLKRSHEVSSRRSKATKKDPNHFKGMELPFMEQTEVSLSARNFVDKLVLEFLDVSREKITELARESEIDESHDIHEGSSETKSIVESLKYVHLPSSSEEELSLSSRSFVEEFVQEFLHISTEQFAALEIESEADESDSLDASPHHEHGIGIELSASARDWVGSIVSDMLQNRENLLDTDRSDEFITADEQQLRSHRLQDDMDVNSLSVSARQSILELVNDGLDIAQQCAMETEDSGDEASITDNVKDDKLSQDTESSENCTAAEANAAKFEIDDEIGPLSKDKSGDSMENNDFRISIESKKTENRIYHNWIPENLTYNLLQIVQSSSVPTTLANTSPLKPRDESGPFAKGKVEDVKHCSSFLISVEANLSSLRSILYGGAAFADIHKGDNVVQPIRNDGRVTQYDLEKVLTSWEKKKSNRTVPPPRGSSNVHGNYGRSSEPRFDSLNRLGPRRSNRFPAVRGRSSKSPAPRSAPPGEPAASEGREAVRRTHARAVERWPEQRSALRRELPALSRSEPAKNRKQALSSSSAALGSSGGGTSQIPRLRLPVA